MFNFIRLLIGDEYELRKLRKLTGVEVRILREIQLYYELEIRELHIDWERAKKKGFVKQKLDIIRNLINRISKLIEKDIKDNKTARGFVLHLLKISPPESKEHKLLADAYLADNRIEELFRLLKRNLQEQLRKINEVEANKFLRDLSIRKEFLAEEISAEQHYLNQVRQSMSLLSQRVGYLFKSRKYFVDYSVFDLSMRMRVNLMNKLPFLKTEDSCEGHIHTDFFDDKLGFLIKPDSGCVFIKHAAIFFRIDEGNEQAKQFLKDLERLALKYPFVSLHRYDGMWVFEMSCDDLLINKHLIKKVKFSPTKVIRLAQQGDKQALDRIKKEAALDYKAMHQALKGPTQKRMAQYKEIWKLFDWILSKYQPR